MIDRTVDAPRHGKYAIDALKGKDQVYSRKALRISNASLTKCWDIGKYEFNQASKIEIPSKI
eukprot:12280584-Ditylum_brightwellii.AAC.1